MYKKEYILYAGGLYITHRINKLYNNIVTEVLTPLFLSPEANTSRLL